MYLVRPYLAVGKLRETFDADLLRVNRISAMVQIAESVPHPGIVSLYLPFEDGKPLPSGVLARAMAFVQEQQSDVGVMLIACGAGISRSVTLAVAAIKEIEGGTLLEAFGKVRQAHPDALPHPALWQSLCDYYGEAVPYLTMFRCKPVRGDPAVETAVLASAPLRPRFQPPGHRVATRYTPTEHQQSVAYQSLTRAFSSSRFRSTMAESAARNSAGTDAPIPMALRIAALLGDCAGSLPLIGATAGSTSTVIHSVSAAWRTA